MPDNEWVRDQNLNENGEKKSNEDFDIIMKVPTDINFKTL